MGNRQALLVQVQNRPAVQAVLEQEPALQHVLHIAAAQEDARERWYSYEALKRIASMFVGWKAKNPMLQNSRCYELMIQAIDELLPNGEEETLSLESPSRLIDLSEYL